MTKLDIKQYLEKIYNVSVVTVNTHNKMGKDFSTWKLHNFGIYAPSFPEFVVVASSVLFAQFLKKKKFLHRWNKTEQIKSHH